MESTNKLKNFTLLFVIFDSTEVFTKFLSHFSSVHFLISQSLHIFLNTTSNFHFGVHAMFKALSPVLC